MSFDLSTLTDTVAHEGRVARVVVAEARGSSPREAGAAMLVWSGGQSGTIGGGALEFEAARRARTMLSCAGPPPTPTPPTHGGRSAPDSRSAVVDRLALGPARQQCCGGSVTLVTEVFDAAALARLRPEAGLVVRRVSGVAGVPLGVKRRLAAARGQGLIGAAALIDGWMIEPLALPTRYIWVWGAGHVGRAIVAVLAPVPGVAITWVDTSAARFPDAMPEGAERLIAADPATLAPFAPETAEHLILTYSHALDLALCHTLLSCGFARCGLIGSATKWVRFRKRLAELGHDAAAIAQIDCPIGDPALGKHPQAIAISVAQALLAQGAVQPTARERIG